MKESPNENQLDTTLNDEESSVTNTDRNNRLSYPSVSAIQNKKQLPTINSNGNNRLSLGSVGRSKTSPEGFNSTKKPSLIKKEHSDNEEKYDFPGGAKLDIHSDVENQSKSKDEKDLNNNSKSINTNGEIIYSIETVLKYLEENYYLRLFIGK